MIVFIGGTGRCGSTMLVKVLKLHPELRVLPHETNLYPINNGNIAAWLKEHVDPHDPRPTIEKTPANTLYADWLLEKLPDARYLHVHRRDRAAVCNSMMRHTYYTVPGWGRPDSFEEVGAFYDWINVRARNVLNRWGPERARLLIYEHVLTEPARALRGLTDWLGVSEPTLAMLDFPYDTSKVRGHAIEGRRV